MDNNDFDLGFFSAVLNADFLSSSRDQNSLDQARDFDS